MVRLCVDSFQFGGSQEGHHFHSHEKENIKRPFFNSNLK